MEILLKIQNELKVPKGNFNSFGKYKYRSAEDILEAVKPILLKNDAIVYLTDEVISVGSKVFVKATAIFYTPTFQISTCGFAETSEHKGMSSEQTTGTASSYARKYALNGLFLIDETESDADSQKPQEVKTIDEARDLARLNACTELKQLQETFTSIANKSVAVIALKDKLKTELK